MKIVALHILLMLTYGVNNPLSQTGGATCRSAQVTEGETGWIEFLIQPDIDIEADHTMFMLTINNDEHDTIIRCYRLKKASSLVCTVLDHRFKSQGFNGHSLLLQIPNATLNVNGVYEIHIIVNGDFKPTTVCHLSVIKKKDPEPEERESGTSWKVIIACLPGAIATTFAIATVLLICRCRYSFPTNTGNVWRVASKMKAFIRKSDEQQQDLPGPRQNGDKTPENVHADSAAMMGEEGAKSSSKGKDTSDTDLDEASSMLLLNMDGPSVQYITAAVSSDDSSIEGRAKESHNPADIAEGIVEGKECAEENDGDVPNVSTQI